MREVATIKAKPVLASQAEKARSIIGAGVMVWRLLVEENVVIIMNRANIMPSIHSRADIKCVRCKDMPMMLRINVEFSIKCIGSM